MSRSTPGTARPGRIWLVVGLILLIHAGLAWLGRDAGITTRQDDANYLILARSLRDFGYHEAYRPDTPVHNMYPPAYPAMIALWGWPFADAFDWLVLLNIGFSAGAIALAFAAFSRFVRPGLAAIAIAPLAVTPGLLSFAGSIATEAPYAFFSMLALYLLMSEEAGRRRWGWALAASITAALTRSVGLTLLSAIALHLALNREWKRLAFFTAVSAATVGAWLLWSALSPEQLVGKSYLADAIASVNRINVVDETSFLARSLRRVPVYFGRHIPWALAVPTVAGTPIDNVLTSAAILTGLAGAAVLVHRRWRVATLYVAIYLTLMMVWTWASERFVLPIVPLILPATVVGLAWLAGLRRREWAFGVAAATSAVLIAGAVPRTADQIRTMSSCDRNSERPDPACMRRDQVSFFRALAYIEERTPKDAVILTAKPEPMYLYTGRRSPFLRGILADGPESFLERLRAEGTDFILLGSLQSMEVARLPRAMLPECEELATEAFFPERTWLFRIRADGEPRSREACDAIERSMELNSNRRFGVDP